MKKVNPESNWIRLGEIRYGVTRKMETCGQTLYVTVNFFEQKPVEVFIVIAKEGSAVRGLMNGIATLISLALRSNVSWERIREKLRYTVFEPNDGHCSSLLHAISVCVDTAIEHYGRSEVKG